MEELNKLLPDPYVNAINRLDKSKLYEVRVRNRAPVRVCYDGRYAYLCPSGITRDRTQAITAGANEAENIVLRACDRSLYTITETLKKGYVPFGGIRLGVCGSSVLCGGSIAAVKDISSVDIRVPHEIKGSAATLASRIGKPDGGIYSTLIVSPPGGGKTTVVRDLCRLLSDGGANILLCDEKYEIAACYRGAPTLDVGVNTDVMSGADKRFAFRAGVAYMRPDIIITDEIFSEDLPDAERAAYSGVSIVSTAHAKTSMELIDKPEFGKSIGRIFMRYAVIDGNHKISVYGAGNGVP